MKLDYIQKIALFIVAFIIVTVVITMLYGCNADPIVTPIEHCTDIYSQSFCDNIKGDKGDDGENGQSIQGPQGISGTNGADGQSVVGPQGEQGGTGNDGSSCSVKQIYETEQQVLQLADTNQQDISKRLSTDSGINSASDDPAGLNTDPIGALIQCTDGTSAMVYNGKDGVNGIDSIQEVIDPCGKQGSYDEVLLRFSDKSLYAVFYTKELAFMTLIGPGAYQTTDGTGCNFKVTDDLEVIW